VTVDSAVPGPKAKEFVCDRCMARVSDLASVCPECGAPLDTSPGGAVAESAVHGELAQANLLRLRGELDEAERRCLSILKRYPNEPGAHSQLGDIIADRGDWARAAQWYELALDLNPKSAGDRAKFADAQKRVEESDTSHTIEQIGLPPANPSRLPWILSAVALLTIIVLAAALFRPTPQPKTATVLNGGVVNAPLVPNTPAATTGTPDDKTSDETTEAATNPSETPPTQAAMPMEDRTLMQLLQQRSAQGAALLSVTQDPRDKVLTLSYAALPADDIRKIGAVLAKDALDESPDTLIVTVRGIVGDRLAFVADASRPKLQEIDSGPAQTGTSDAWISTLLQREWTPSSVPPNTQVVGSSGPGSKTSP